MELRIPQQAPFRFIDHLIVADKDSAVSEYSVREDSLLLVDGAMSTAALMENIAQTCAAWLGQQSSQIKIGMIGAVKRMQVNAFPMVGECLTTRIQVVQQVFSMTLVQAQVYRGTDLLAFAEMKIALMN